jgi:sugar phosphate isomerase/epimerase
LSFSDDDGSVRQKALENVKKIIELASNFKASIIIGLIRGTVKNAGKKGGDAVRLAEERICSCLGDCMNYSKKSGMACRHNLYKNCHIICIPGGFS